MDNTDNVNQRNRKIQIHPRLHQKKQALNTCFKLKFKLNFSLYIREGIVCREYNSPEMDNAHFLNAETFGKRAKAYFSEVEIDKMPRIGCSCSGYSAEIFCVHAKHGLEAII